MKIANWNLERLKHQSKINEIIQILNEFNADILVLTETDSRLKLENYNYNISTSNLSELNLNSYQKTENRVTIYSKYEIINHFETFDKNSSLCIALKTDYGDLVIYATIIGIYGNRNENFNIDLQKQLIDFDKYSKNSNLCIIGDYNISFSDNYYFTKFGREELEKSFENNKLTLLTRNQNECIDHIAISTKFIENFKHEVFEWNLNKKLSDHKGILVELTKYYK